MSSNRDSICAAPKTGRTKVIAVATLVPVLAGSLVATSPAQAAPVSEQASATTNAAAAQALVTRATKKPMSAKKKRVLKVKRTNVFVVGDSLTVGSKNSIQRNLKRKTRSVRVNAKVGRFTPTGISILRSSQAKRAHVWVVALGTNDGPNAGATKRNVRKVMRMAGKRQVIWLTVVRPGQYSRVNTALKQMDRKYSNLTIADWASVVKRNKRLLSGDRVHLTAHGYSVRGKYVANAVVKIAGQ